VGPGGQWKRRRRKGKSGRVGDLDRGKRMGRAREGRERREEGGEAVGWAARGEKKGKKEKGKWAGPNRKKRGKINVFQMHVNLNLNFKFKWKTTNKIMQRACNAQNPYFLIFLFMFY
jgi:hypothetical protein